MPIKAGGKVLGEIDIDSDLKDTFTSEDRSRIESVAKIIAVPLSRETKA